MYGVCVKVAIYDRKGSFSDRWIRACDERDLPYITVDLFSDGLIETLRREKVDVLLAHPPMGDRRAALAAHAIIQSLVASGLCQVFPTLEDFWHFDDKIAQKYLFEAADIPTPKTHVFLERHQAVDWAVDATFPWVFKLKAGAGAVNVCLLRSRGEAMTNINRMFGQGYAPYAGATKDIANKLRKHRRNRDWLVMARRASQTLASYWKKKRDIANERGYVYVQEFIAENTHDTRVTVIGDRAFAFRRMVRPGEFRASGSGMIDHEPRNIDKACVEMACNAAARLGTSCMAFDFVQPKDETKPLIVEMSYAFVDVLVYQCPGHWRSDMSWQEGQMWPEDAIFDDALQKIKLQ